MTEVQTHPNNSSSTDWYRPFGIWIALVFGLGILSIVVIELAHDSWGDICSEFHEPPTTVVGFSVAALAVGVPLAFALFSRARPVVLFAVAAAALEVLVFWLVFLTANGTCS